MALYGDYKKVTLHYRLYVYSIVGTMVTDHEMMTIPMNPLSWDPELPGNEGLGVGFR